MNNQNGQQLLPFKFYTEFGIVRWSGLKADSLSSLLSGLENVSGSSIFYHLHHALFRRQRYTFSDCMNDFSRWVMNVLGQKVLAEKLASIDPLQHNSIRAAREKLIAHIKNYVGEGEVFVRVPRGRELHFMELKSFVVPTNVEANDITEFIRGLKNLGAGAMIYHFIESRYRKKGRYPNDFSEWLSYRNEIELADKLNKLNPFLYDLKTLKESIINILEKKV